MTLGGWLVDEEVRRCAEEVCGGNGVLRGVDGCWIVMID